jgi:hypothetical protein
VRKIYEGRKELVNKNDDFDDDFFGGGSGGLSRGRRQWRGATLSTKPTKKGAQELDLFHRFHGLQHVTKKPCLLMVEEAEAALWRPSEEEEAALQFSSVGFAVGGDGVEASRKQREEHSGEHNTNDVRCQGGHAEMRQCLYLRLLEAKKEGLITVKIDPPESTLPGSKHDPLGHFRGPFETHGALVATTQGNQVAEAWNGQRLLVLEEAIKDRLLPSLRKGLEAKLLKSAKDAVVAGACRKFRQK